MGFVRKVSDKIMGVTEDVVEPVVNLIEPIFSDPKKLAMIALSVMAPGAGTALGTAMGLTGTAATIVGQAAINTAINGGDIKSGILAAAIPVVGKELAGVASSAFVDAGLDQALAESAGKVVAGTGLAAAQGKDPLAALISGGLFEGTSAITRDLPGFSDLPDAAKKSINAAVAIELSGGDGTQAAVNAAISSGMNALNNYKTSEAPADVVADLENAGLQEKTPTGPGYYDEITGNFILDPLGGMQGPLGPETGNFDPNQEWEYSLTKPGVWTSKDGQEIDLSYMPDRDTAMTGKELMDRAGVSPGSLKTGAKSGAKPATPGAKPATPGSKIPGAVVSALTGAAGAAGTAGAAGSTGGTPQGQSPYEALLNLMGSNNQLANIKSNQDLFGSGVFASPQKPEPQSDEQDNSQEAEQATDGFFNGGQVNNITVDDLLQILRS